MRNLIAMAKDDNVSPEEFEVELINTVAALDGQ